VLVQGVQGSPNAIGFFGYAYYEENRRHPDILDINGLSRTPPDVDDHTYPLARPLFIYSDATIMTKTAGRCLYQLLLELR
jgi:phosphate transport system substrate-binding protein